MQDDRLSARECEMLAYAPESLRFVGLHPFVPDPLWYQRRWFEDARVSGRKRLVRAFAIIGFCLVLAAGGAFLMKSHARSLTGLANAGVTAVHGTGPMGALPSAAPSGTGLG